MTEHFEQRFQRHDSGLNKTTAPYAPFTILMTEEVDSSRIEARKREKYWKSGTGKRKLRKLRENI